MMAICKVTVNDWQFSWAGAADLALLVLAGYCSRAWLAVAIPYRA
jgi:hypothetical protein